MRTPVTLEFSNQCALLSLLATGLLAAQDTPVQAAVKIVRADQSIQGRLTFSKSAGARGAVDLDVRSTADNAPATQDGRPVLGGRYRLHVEYNGTFSGEQLGLLNGDAKLSGTFETTPGSATAINGSGKFHGSGSRTLGLASVTADWERLDFQGSGVRAGQPFSVYVVFSFPPEPVAITGSRSIGQTTRAPDRAGTPGDSIDVPVHPAATLSDRDSPLRTTTATAAASCSAPTLPYAYLTAGVAQPPGWQRPVAIPWQKGVTANDCYRKCLDSRDFKCRAFVLEEHPSFGAQCWLSSMDRSDGLTVTPSPPSTSGRYTRNYWEVRDCQGSAQPQQQTAPPPPPVTSVGGSCSAPTLPYAYLTAGVAQPPGWQRPVAIPWQKGVTANDCYRKCLDSRDFKCRAFVLEEHPSFGAQCWLSSMDRSDGLTVTPSPPSTSGRYTRNYWEVRDCQGGGSAAPPTPSAGGSCASPTLPDASLSAGSRQPTAWQRPVGIPWRRGLTVEDCYRKCAGNPDFPCHSFVIEEHADFGAQCLISNFDRSDGVIVTPSPPDAGFRRNYWEMKDCHATGATQR